ncbi:YcbK family protein [Rouxiella badensis]|uniref:YcbK family protein n=1 Tax=Rouxiella badensis TaxID=1646377 RepID=UPI0028AD858F|nr:YcbK family protein [Rouxiella badensis]
MDQIDKYRRKWLALGGATMGMAMLPNDAFAMLATPRPRVLVINNLHTGETLKTEFFDGKQYNRDELARLNHLFRDYRAGGQVKNIDPQLFDHLYRLQIALGINKPVQLVSGYRTLATNNMLRKPGSGVAKHSYHTLGRAMDFHIEGVELANIRKAALKMRMGGVGYYPRSDFVHIDTGPNRSWS